jgi:hypothetical protein
MARQPASAHLLRVACVALKALSATGMADYPAWPLVPETAMLTAAETIRHPGALLRRHPDQL